LVSQHLVLGKARRQLHHAQLERVADMHGVPTMRVYHPEYGERWLFAEGSRRWYLRKTRATCAASSDRRMRASPKNGISDFVTKGQRYRLNAEQFRTSRRLLLLDIPAAKSATVKFEIQPQNQQYGKTILDRRLMRSFASGSLKPMSSIGRDPRLAVRGWAARHAAGILRNALVKAVLQL